MADVRIEFDVIGLPGPQGSKKAVGRRKNGSTIMVEMSKRVKPWREAVVAAARSSLASWVSFAEGPVFPKGVPVNAAIEFRMPRGKTVKREEHTTTPDLDKLIRSTSDALKMAGVLQDDSQIVSFHGTEKRYALPGEEVGAYIVLTGKIG